MRSWSELCTCSRSSITGNCRSTSKGYGRKTIEGRRESGAARPEPSSGGSANSRTKCDILGRGEEGEDALGCKRFVMPVRISKIHSIIRRWGARPFQPLGKIMYQLY